MLYASSALYTTTYLRTLDLARPELLIDLITHHKLHTLMRLQPRNEPTSHRQPLIALHHTQTACKYSKRNKDKLTSHASPTNAASHYSADES
jgi:hypothetical protein